MNNKRLTIMGLIFLIAAMTYSQSMVGMWGVDKVTVGDRILTPVAKWFFFEADFTQRSGNGWSQNMTGTWTFDKKTKAFLPYDRFGNPDEYGSFNVRIEGDKMYWNRTEDGMAVDVSLTRIDAMPMAPKDSIAGNWDLVKVEKDGKDITDEVDPNNQDNIFISWTMDYRKTNADGSRSFGFWHMHAHRSEFRLINSNTAEPILVYMVSFKDDLVIMEQRGAEGNTLTYRRVTQ